MPLATFIPWLSSKPKRVKHPPKPPRNPFIRSTRGTR